MPIVNCTLCYLMCFKWYKFPSHRCVINYANITTPTKYVDLPSTEGGAGKGFARWPIFCTKHVNDITTSEIQLNKNLSDQFL